MTLCKLWLALLMQANSSLRCIYWPTMDNDDLYHIREDRLDTKRSTNSPILRTQRPHIWQWCALSGLGDYNARKQVVWVARIWEAYPTFAAPSAVLIIVFRRGHQSLRKIQTIIGIGAAYRLRDYDWTGITSNTDDERRKGEKGKGVGHKEVYSKDEVLIHG